VVNHCAARFCSAPDDLRARHGGEKRLLVRCAAVVRKSPSDDVPERSLDRRDDLRRRGGCHREDRVSLVAMTDLWRAGWLRAKLAAWRAGGACGAAAFVALQVLAVFAAAVVFAVLAFGLLYAASVPPPAAVAGLRFATRAMRTEEVCREVERERGEGGGGS
jgi:hypothetical protein